MIGRLSGLGRVGVSIVAVATVTALAPLLAATSASADPGTKISFASGQQTGAAGTCLAYSVTVADDFGRPATDAGTVSISLTESPNSGSQDVDFCTPPTGSSTPSTAPGYTNATFPNKPAPAECIAAGLAPGCTIETANMRQTYTAGPSVTSPAANTGGDSDTVFTSNNPDSAANTASSSNKNNNANPSGTDNASFSYNSTVNAGSTITFGVAGLTAGGATLTAFIDFDNNRVRRETASGSAKAEPATAATSNFTDGGPPGSAAAANAAQRLSVTPEASIRPLGSPTHTFQVTVRNGNGNTLAGVIPSYFVQSGPGQTATPSDCPTTDNSGVSTCSYTPTVAGTDGLVFFVNQTRGTPTAGPDSGEPQTTASARTTPTPVSQSQARTIDLVPDNPTTTAGDTREFVAEVTSATGAPAQGVAVTFVENGPGVFSGAAESNGMSVASGSTDATGRVSVTVLTVTGQPGTQTISATINNAVATECQATGGRCSDTSTHTISGPSASSAPSATATATMTATATATATMSATASPTATQTATTTSTATSTTKPCTNTVRVTVNTPFINATGLASVTITGATPGARAILEGYSQVHAGTATFANAGRVVRTGTADSDGSITFNDIRPSSNTRVRAQQEGCGFTNTTPQQSAGAVINVRTTLFLQVTRLKARSFRFSIDSIPAREGGLIVGIYRVTGSTCAAGVEPRSCPGEVLVGQARVSALSGAGTVVINTPFANPSDPRRAYPQGREQFVLKTGQDAQNAPGRSNVRDLALT